MHDEVRAFRGTTHILGIERVADMPLKLRIELATASRAAVGVGTISFVIAISIG